MAVQPYLFLRLTDGTTDITFSDGANGSTNYPPQSGGWAPNVAALDQSLLGGRGPYTDVVEEITINVRGTTAATCYANLDALARLLDQADRWWMRAEAVTPVVLKWAPQGSTAYATATPLQALVLGRVPGDTTSAAQLPPTFDSAGNQFVTYGVTIKILRRGTWSGTNDTTGASGASANPTVMTRAFGATHPLSSPVDITIGGFNGTTTPTIQAGYLVIGSTSTDIQIIEAEGGATGAFTSVADAANNARGGNVLRYTPASTAAATCAGISMTLTGGQCAVIAAVRNNSATATYQIQANFSGFGLTTSTPAVTIDTSSTQPRLVLLGVSGSNAQNTVSVTATASATGAGTLDIDYLIILNLRNETTAIIAHDAASLATAGAGAASLAFDYSPSSDRTPRIFVSGSGGNVSLTYRGVVPIQSVGANIYAAWTAPNGASWRFTTTAPAVLSVTLNATRYQQYLTAA